MTLGEHICALRTARGLSQGDLAERLGVSRQSVSKWETDASVPDLDKLVNLSQTFGVTLDELVHGPAQPPQAEPRPAETAPPAPESAPPEAAPDGKSRVPGWKVGGLVFLGLGVLLLLLLLDMGSLSAGLLFASPFLLSAAACLILRRRYVALVCGWVLWLLVIGYFHYATGIRPWWVFSPWVYRPGMEIHVLVAWAQALSWLGLAAATVLAFLRRRKK